MAYQRLVQVLRVRHGPEEGEDDISSAGAHLASGSIIRKMESASWGTARDRFSARRLPRKTWKEGEGVVRREEVVELE